MTPYSTEYAGVEWPEKVHKLRTQLKEDNLTAMVISELVRIQFEQIWSNFCNIKMHHNTKLPYPHHQ